jgi:hypothetical protein
MEKDDKESNFLFNDYVTEGEPGENILTAARVVDDL